jgi:hypothetical protein
MRVPAADRAPKHEAADGRPGTRHDRPAQIPLVCGLLVSVRAVIDVLDREVELLFAALGAAKLGAAIGQHLPRISACGPPRPCWKFV